MRGHGFASAARSIIEVVRLSVYLPRNARVQMNAMRMGGKPKPLSKGEIAARAAGYKPNMPETWRAWEYWRPAPAAATKSASRTITPIKSDSAKRLPTACH